ncbi:arylsulfatase [Labilibaculum sp.]|uniref:arylsulfatase n=1 Tax=Labilibaculum sp. TaxID=2060723 RepID=UPI00356782BC
MNLKNKLYICCGLMGIFSLCGCNASKEKNGAEEDTSKPNIVYILADDLGYGDLSCYGQEKFQTPNIDRLAANGMKFTQHYSGSSVCAPSRSTLLTGEDTGHTPIRGNMEVMPEGQNPIPAEAVTLAEVLKTAGYTTGAFGKWGLGYPGSEGDPNNQGFDEFYGYNCQRMAHRYYPPYLWHNQEKIHMAGNDWQNTVTYAHDEIQKAVFQFLENNKDTSFFAFVPFALPHAELISPDDSILATCKGRFEEKPYTASEGGDYGPDLEIWKYCSQPTPRAMYMAMVTRMDAYVGQIVSKLEELGIADNTIIMFASDNGPHDEGGGDPEFFKSSGKFRGIKRDLYEGGIRCPFITVWPGKIKQGTVSDHISAFWDVLPTLAEITGAKLSSPIDGISMLPTLLQKDEQKEHDYLYWEFHEKGGRLAVRMGDWKGVIYNVSKHGKFELYNLSEDPSERNDIAEDHPDIVAKIKEIMKNARTESDIFKFQMSTLVGN